MAQRTSGEWSASSQISSDRPGTSEPINLISTAPAFGVSGGTKVFFNLTKGLEQIGQPYVVNRKPAATSRLWVHNDVFALPAVLRDRGVRAVLGPNLFDVPRDIPLLDLTSRLYVVASDWIFRLWRETGFTSPLHVWPVGVDTDEFRPSDERMGGDHVLVYHKMRSRAELSVIERAVSASGLTCAVVRYGHYTEANYKRSLSQASLVIWHGCAETQGLALLEALSSGVPVLVCDVTSIDEPGHSQSTTARRRRTFPATSAPYFDATCGMRITDLSTLPRAIEELRRSLGNYRPREFVLQNMSLEARARAFVSLFETLPAGPARSVPVDPWALPPWRPSAADVLSLRLRRRLHVVARTVRGD